MKSDRDGAFNLFLVLAAGLVVSLSGCVSVSPEPASDVGEPQRDFPEAPLTVSPYPDVPAVPFPIRHVPTVPQPDVVLRAPFPESLLRSDSPELSARPKTYQKPPKITLPPPVPVRVTESHDWSMPIPKIALTPRQLREDASSRGAVEPGATGESLEQREEPQEIPQLSRTERVEARPSQPRSEAEAGAVSPDGASPSQQRSQTRSVREPREDTSTERTVAVGERFQVALPGRGWVYLGGGEVLQFLDRTTEGEDVVFSFRGPPAGTAPEERTVLEFESQDFITGSRSRHEEQILIAETDGDGGTEDQAPADVRSETGSGGGATAGASAAGANTGTLEDASPEELFRRVNEFEASARYEAAADLLEGMSREALGGDDEITFRLAQLYEAEWEGRDLRRARDLYRMVVENYPLSRWRRPARERIEYLNRHFFHIR